MTLNPAERKSFGCKIRKLGFNRGGCLLHIRTMTPTPHPNQTGLIRIPLSRPEPYSEKGIKREIRFTERELNGLLAKNTDLAKKLAIDLSDDLISAKLLLPVDEDFPILGGKIFSVSDPVWCLRTIRANPSSFLKALRLWGCTHSKCVAGRNKRIWIW